MTSSRPAPSHLWVWFVWVAAVYATWAWLVFGNEGQWSAVRTHWPIALAMVFGSYVAGSTPMGGGTVGFPILVLLFGLSARLGRDFSFAVQSVGMVSAAIFILARGQRVAWPVLLGAMLGAVIGLPVGLFVFAPRVPDLWVKLIFAVAWASFGVMHLYRFRMLVAQQGMTAVTDGWSFGVGVLSGALAGATIVAATGVGVDMFVYVVMVLLCRADLKVAIPTAVIAMAFTSVLGFALVTATDGLAPGTVDHWLAAVPVVVLGAPVGAYVVSRVGRAPTLLMVAALCVFQFGWTWYVERSTLGVAGLAGGVVVVGLFLMLFRRMEAWGALRAIADRGHIQPP